MNHLVNIVGAERRAREAIKVLHKLARYLTGHDFKLNTAECRRQNRLAIRYLAMAGIPVSLVNIAAQIIIKGAPGLGKQSGWLLLYFVVLNLADRFVIPTECPRSTLLVYLLEAPVMAVAILLGTVWDPNHQALTFMMFMVVMPVFILDRPARVMGVMLLWNAVFFALCVAVKNPSTRSGDFFHMLEFLLSSFAVTNVVLRLRMEVISNYNRAQYHIEHDALTGALNRRSLEGAIDRYLGHPMILLLGDLDRLTLFNDFYGHDMGDQLLCAFADVLKGSFGEADTYRYGGDELLCVAVSVGERDLLERLEECRQQLNGTRFEKHPAALSCAFGYVTGTPKDVETFRKMLQLAEIYVHRAAQQGQGQTIGSHYDEIALREGIVESNINTHSRVYETNQLTGLPALSYFIGRAEELVCDAVIPERRPVVGFFNIVRFRDYNDAYGYTQGDVLIKYVAQLLREAFPKRLLAYISGSRFAMLVYEDEAQTGMRKIHETLKDYKPGREIAVKAGFAEADGHTSVISLLDKAMRAHDSIYHAKDVNIRLYDDALDAEYRFRQYIVSHLDQAIASGWIKVYYQPIIRAVTGEVCNFEALSRWDDPFHGLLQPGRFIGALEEARVIYRLNLHVVSQVLKDFKELERRGLPLLPVSVNLSRNDFVECDMVSEITARVDAAGYPHSLIKIEITESVFIENRDFLKGEVDRFRANGFEVWMDDFGSEFSTLNLLQDMDFDLIKIDMQFMHNFAAGARNAIIVSDIIDMSKRLGFTTLIEGVETREQYAILRRMGCEKMQGFLFSRPCPLQTIIKYATDSRVLKLEDPALVEYYAELGRIDLASPISFATDDSPVPSQMPAGILEDRGGRLSCIRGNDAFLTVAGLLGAEGHAGQRQYPLPLPNPPAPLTHAIRAAETDERWSRFSADGGDGRGYAFYIRQIAISPEGTRAVLVTVLPG